MCKIFWSPLALNKPDSPPQLSLSPPRQLQPPMRRSSGGSRLSMSRARSWVKLFDHRSMRSYWHNTVTGRSQWENPDANGSRAHSMSRTEAIAASAASASKYTGDVLALSPALARSNARPTPTCCARPRAYCWLAPAPASPQRLDHLPPAARRAFARSPPARLSPHLSPRAAHRPPARPPLTLATRKARRVRDRARACSRAPESPSGARRTTRSS